MSDKPETRAERAARHARSHARPKGVVPHYLRCDEVDGDDRRCRKFDGHDGPHAFEEPG